MRQTELEKKRGDHFGSATQGGAALALGWYKSAPSGRRTWLAHLAYLAYTKGQRREPAADDVEFVSERIGWLPFAAPSGWRIGRPPRTLIFVIAA